QRRQDRLRHCLTPAAGLPDGSSLSPSTAGPAPNGPPLTGPAWARRRGKGALLIMLDGLPTVTSQPRSLPSTSPAVSSPVNAPRQVGTLTPAARAMSPTEALRRAGIAS